MLADNSSDPEISLLIFLLGHLEQAEDAVQIWLARLAP